MSACRLALSEFAQAAEPAAALLVLGRSVLAVAEELGPAAAHERSDDALAVTR